MKNNNFFYERPQGSRQMYEFDNRELTPWEILGIAPNADEKTIKNAYRKLARKWHPDKNTDPQAEQRFKEINGAYEKLSKVRPEDINFEELFGSGMEEILGGLFGNMMNLHENNKSVSILHDVNVTLEELYTGTEKIIQYTRDIIDPKVQNEMCSRCKGSGMVSIIEKLNAIMLSQRMNKCQHCNGKGFSGHIIEKLEEINVTIPPGTANDEKIVLQNLGHENLNGSKGDLIVQTVSHQHDFYERRGNDLQCEIKIAFKEAMLGFEKIIPKLDGTKLKLKFKGPIQFGKVKRIKEKGMPILNTHEHGNLNIHFVFNLPKVLTEEQKTLIDENF